MRPLLRLAVCATVILCVAGTSSASSAVMSTKIHDFDGADGDAPHAGLLLAGDGNPYGTTSEGGPLIGAVAVSPNAVWAPAIIAAAAPMAPSDVSVQPIRNYCCWPSNMGLVVGEESLKRLMHTSFTLGSDRTTVLRQIERYGWVHTAPRPTLISIRGGMPCTQDCLQGTMIEAWVRCKSMNIARLKFPFVSKYGLVWKEYVYEERC